MQIQVNTDNNVEGSEQLESHVRSMLESALNRFSDRITRVEVHLGDENGRKSGQADKRCMMEVRVEGRQPTAVTHHAATVEQAIDGAMDKLVSSIDTTLGRLRDQNDHKARQDTV